MLADIVRGEVDWADVVFLIALILAVVAAFIAWPQRTLTNVCGWAAVAAIALGLLLL